jgi:hypothetical protein
MLSIRFIERLEISIRKYELVNPVAELAKGFVVINSI